MAHPPASPASPASLGGVISVIMATYWEDVDAAWERAVAPGAEVVYPPKWRGAPPACSPRLKPAPPTRAGRDASDCPYREVRPITSRHCRRCSVRPAHRPAIWLAGRSTFALRPQAGAPAMVAQSGSSRLGIVQRDAAAGSIPGALRGPRLASSPAAARVRSRVTRRRATTAQQREKDDREHDHQVQQACDIDAAHVSPRRHTSTLPLRWLRASR
jgi:hypothetical protein